MAGHSKWANIKHKKEKGDKQKGKIFSSLAKEIISAVKLGGPDPKGNTRLRLAIQKARAANMPGENVERNIKKALHADQKDYESITYEIYGHGGVGLIVEAMTDNKNRTASEMRIATNKRGGTSAQPGAVAFNFDRKGIIHVPFAPPLEEEALFALALEAGAENFEVLEGEYLLVTAPSDFYAVREQLEAKGVVHEGEIAMIPKHLVSCDPETRLANQALIEWLEELEDVDAVYHNMELG